MTLAGFPQRGLHILITVYLLNNQKTTNFAKVIVLNKYEMLLLLNTVCGNFIHLYDF